MDITELEPSNDHENVLVLTDVCSKFSWVIPMKDQTALIFAKMLVKHFIVPWAPLRIHSDNGKCFEDRVVAELCKLYGIERFHTTLPSTGEWPV